MQIAWSGIFGAALLSTAACAELDAPESSHMTTSANTQDVDGTDVATSDLGYGWTANIPATASNGFKEDFSISDIVTNPTVKVRKDNLACVTCHSWAGFADRQSFCDRVDAFIAEPTSTVMTLRAPNRNT